jgi:hypothetical protein
MSRLRLIVAAAACTLSCGQPTAPAPAPAPVDPSAPTVGAHTGAVAIEYVGATIAPGSTIAGCGPTIGGCTGRLRLSFRLRPVNSGTVLFTAATLHGVTKVACLSASGAGFSLAANTTPIVDLVFDQFDPRCPLPFDSTDLAVTIEGTTEVASRQEFGIRYRFTQ